MAVDFQEYIRKTANWTVGFMITLDTAHGLDWQDYRDAGWKVVFIRIVAFLFMWFIIIYIAFGLPPLWTGALLFGGFLGIFLVVFQWSAIKMLKLKK